MKKYIVAIFILLIPCATFAQHHAHNEAKQPRPTPGRVEVPLSSFELPDSWLVDQNGKKVRFYSDVVKGKVVVVHFFFTKCSDVCPMQGRSLVRLRKQLGDRLGRDVFFVSISKDPKNDTPEKLNAWGKLYNVGTGWTLLTGEPEVIKKLLWNFAGEEIGQATHESMITIGNDRTGVWTTTDGLLLPKDLLAVIDKISQ